MRKTAIFFFTSCLYTMLLADSPLTSTLFYQAYENNEMVQYALKKGGLDDKVGIYLIDKSTPLAQKLATVSALGWHIDGKDNALRFARFLEKKYKIVNLSFENGKHLKKLSGDELICLGYLQALDDYFNPQKALTLVQEAKRKNKKSYATHLIAGLVEAQIAFDSDWCEVWRKVECVKLNKRLKMDFLPEAEEIIFSYMRLYKSECN